MAEAQATKAQASERRQIIVGEREVGLGKWLVWFGGLLLLLVVGLLWCFFVVLLFAR